MSGIRGKDTRPETIVRRGMHARGFRFRLHDSRLPGKPDLVFPRYRSAVFVHGCFWHRHGCHLFRWPKTREEFWRHKIGRNAERDATNVEALTAANWRVGIVWECALRGRLKLSTEEVISSLSNWLVKQSGNIEIMGMENDPVSHARND